MASNTMSALLSGMAGPLGGLGREQMRQSKIQELKDIAQRGGATEQQNLFANGVQDSAGLGQHLFANGRTEAFPFLGQEQSFQNQQASQAQGFANSQMLQGTAFNNAQALQNARQAHQIGMADTAYQRNMASEQAKQAAVYNSATSPVVWQQFNKQAKDVQAAGAGYSALENIENIIQEHGTSVWGNRQARAKLNQEAEMIMLQTATDMGMGALTERERPALFRSIFGVDSFDQFADIMDQDYAAATGALQQLKAKQALRGKQGWDHLTNEGSSKRDLSAAAQQVGGYLPAAVRDFDPNISSTMERKARAKKLSPTVRQDFKDRTTTSSQDMREDMERTFGQ
jgi:hypothetical protein